MNIPVSDLPVTDGSGLDYTVEIESKKKLDESQQILKQHLGDNWKVVMFFMILFIFGSVVLILYGIELTPPSTSSSSDNPSFLSKISDAVRPHLKIFFIIIIISIVFLTIWYVVKPEKDTTIYGVVPFPTDRPYVPPDNTSCGTGIVSCVPGNDDCSSACAEKNGNNLYQCTTIDKDKKVYYLGTPLQPGQSYCLPKQNIQNLTKCATYTGKAVFTSSKSGEGWECQCLYPDLFAGPICDEQLACSTTNGHGKLVGQVGGKKVYWDPQSMDPSVVNMTPYDRDGSNNPIFTCECPKSKGNFNYNVYPNDPYVCHADYCLSGEGNSAVAKFDPTTMQCVCDGGSEFNQSRTVTKSNISGYCYPYGNALCGDPHPVSGQCTYGLDPFQGDGTPIMFLMDSIPYITYNFTDSNKNKYPILVDLSSFPGGAPSPQVDMAGTLFKDTFRAFPIKKFSDLSESDQGAVEGFVNNDGTTASIISSVIQATSTPGYTKYCGSYFYDRPNYPACVDQLSKTGNDFVQVCKTKPVSGEAECGGPKDSPYGQCQTDITNTSTGRECVCLPGNYKIDPVNGQCETCLANGEEEPQIGSNPDLCCSGNDREKGSGPFGWYKCVCADDGMPCLTGKYCCHTCVNGICATVNH